MSKTLTPIFGKVFIERKVVPREASRLYIPQRVAEDEGVILDGGSSDFRVGEYVKFNLRGASEVQFENRLIISVDADQILAIIT